MCWGFFVNQKFWDSGSFWSIVQAFMPLCMGQKNEKCRFISISMRCCHIRTHRQAYVCNSVRLTRGNHGPGMQHWHGLAEVFSCPFLRAAFKTNSQVKLQNCRFSITFFSMRLSPSFPSTLSVELVLSLCLWLGFCRPSPNFITFWSRSSRSVKQQRFDS